jgi:GT2 family glycosyltransferase
MSKPPPRLSICILSYNRKEALELTLNALHQLDISATGPVEVIVVENASTDGSAHMVASKFPGVELITLQKNLGMPAMNQGFEAAQGQYVLALDDDSHPEHGLEAALDYLDRHKEVGALALNIKGGMYRIQGKKHLDLCMGFIGCGVLFRRSVLEAVGGYAPWIFLYANEWEHAIRIVESGAQIRYFEACLVHHRVAVSNRSNRRLRMLTTRNELLIIERYYANDPRKPGLLRRTLMWNRLFAFLEGPKALAHVQEGKKMYEADRTELGHTLISQRVRDIYAHQHWSLQPLFPNAAYQLFQKLGLMSKAPHKPIEPVR